MVEVSIDGLDNIIKSIKGFELFTDDLGHDIGNIGVETASERIESTKVDLVGNKWEDSKRSLILGRDRLLLDTGGLLRSLGYSLEQMRQGVVILQSNIEYGKYLQEGTPKMTARPFLGLSDKDIEEAKRVVIEYVQKKLS